MAEVNQQLSRDARRSRRWGVLLAGGDGTRLKNLTRLISGDDRPKQFCRLFGDESLLGLARKRAERNISPEQILVLLTRSHRAFYVQEPGIRPSQRIVQSENRGTAPPILYSLLSIEQIDDDAIVATLPSDHHFSDEPAFTVALECAFETAAQHPGSVILLGASPQGPEVEYGWIELGPSVHGAGGVWSRVRGFFEKPSLHAARELLARGSLWNTFVMVGHVRGFLEMVNASVADAVERLRGNRLWIGAEVHVQNFAL
jgi:mannose-1-phosphate guanylyltransferase